MLKSLDYPSGSMGFLIYLTEILKNMSITHG
jgi:hypothetical protein